MHEFDANMYDTTFKNNGYNFKIILNGQFL